MPTDPKERTPPPPDLRQAATALMRPAPAPAPPRAKAPAADSILQARQDRQAKPDLRALTPGKTGEAGKTGAGKTRAGAKGDKAGAKGGKAKAPGVFQCSLGVFQDTDALSQAAGSELSAQAREGGRPCVVKAMLDVPGIAQVQLTLDLTATRRGGKLALDGAADWTLAKVQHLGLAGLKPGTTVSGSAGVASDSGFEAVTLLLAAMAPKVAAADQRLAAAIYEGEAGFFDLVEEADAEAEEGVETDGDDNSVNDKEKTRRAGGKVGKEHGAGGDDEAARKQGAMLALKQAIKRVGWDIEVRGAGKQATLVGKTTVTPAKEPLGDAVIAGAQNAAAAVKRTVQKMSVAAMPQEARTVFEQISGRIMGIGRGQVKPTATHDAEKVDLRLKLKMSDSGRFRFNVDAVRVKRFDKRMRPPGRASEGGTALRTGLRLLSVGG